MKAILEFDLNDADDAIAFDLGHKAGDMLVALNEIKEYLRELDKYGIDGASEEVTEQVSKIRQRVIEIIYENNLNDI